MMTPKNPAGRAGSGSVANPSPERPKQGSAENALEIGRRARTHGLRMFVNLDGPTTCVVFECPETLKSTSALVSPEEAMATMTGYCGGGMG